MFYKNAMPKVSAENAVHVEPGRHQLGHGASDQAAPDGQPRRHARIPAWPILIILSIGCFGLGHLHATLQTLHSDRRALIWALSSEGERARRLAPSGLLQAVEACTVPSQSRTSACCSALPGLVNGETWAFCASPIR